MINIKSKNTDFWMDKVINNEQIWEGYFLNEKITEKSKIVYTGFLNEEKGIMECGWVVYPNLNYLLGFLQNIFIPTCLITWFYKEVDDFFVLCGDFEESYERVKEDVENDEFNKYKLLEDLYYRVDKLWEENNEEKVLNAIEDICNEVNLSFDCDPEKKLFIKIFNSPENIPDFIKEVLVFEDEEFIEEETSMDYETLDYTLKNVLKEPLINRKIIDILNSNMKIMF